MNIEEKVKIDLNTTMCSAICAHLCAHLWFTTLSRVDTSVANYVHRSSFMQVTRSTEDIIANNIKDYEY